MSINLRALRRLIILTACILLPSLGHGRTVALLVSNSNYTFHDALPGTEIDTLDMQDALITIFGADPVDVRRFHDTIQTPDQFEEQILDLFAIPGADVYVIFYAGHGARSRDISMLSFDWGYFRDFELNYLLAEAPGQVVFITDSCEAGGFVKNSANKSNVAVLASSAINRLAGDDEVHGGFFSQALYDAFTWHRYSLGNRDSYFPLPESFGSFLLRNPDRNRDDKVSLIESFNYAKAQTRNINRWLAFTPFQNPQFGGEDRRISLDHVWVPEENLDFRRGNLVGWDHEGDVRVIQAQGSIKPSRGKHMAIITTGSGSVDGVYSELWAYVPLKNPNRRVQFRWNFLSNEYPTWMGTPINDRFEVWIASNAGQWREVLMSDSVNSAKWRNSRSGYYGETGWRMLRFVPAQHGITGGGMWLKFLVTDVGDSNVDSAALIDFIRLP